MLLHLTKLLEWSRRWGGWVAATVLAAVTAIFYLLLRTKPKPKPTPTVELVRAEAEHQADKKAWEAERAAQVKAVEIVEQAEEKRDAVVAKVRDDTATLPSDTAVTDYLKSIGREQR